MSEIVLAFPILAGNVEAWRRFCQELSGSRRTQYEDSRQQLGLTHERMALFETPQGAMALTTLKGEDIIHTLGKLVASNSPFDIWYRKCLYELHGINLAGYDQFSRSNTIPRKLETIFVWTAEPEIEGTPPDDTKGQIANER